VKGPKKSDVFKKNEFERYFFKLRASTSILKGEAETTESASTLFLLPELIIGAEFGWGKEAFWLEN
ncbi:MAG: hypothetical protein IJY15_04825, partial [Thermoguttaceae bacterium]|nr:hypothetical protein [Thermoguttaceae bacterium]